MAMTFEEWWNDHYSHRLRDKGECQYIWDVARQGMIPEDEAVRIPPVEEWPVWANRISVFFDGRRLPIHVRLGGSRAIVDIERPNPRKLIWHRRNYEPRD